MLVKKKSAIHKKIRKSPKVKGLKFHFKLYYVSVFCMVIIAGIFSFFAFRSAQKIICANSISCVKDLSVKIENNAMGIFEGHKVIPPKIILSQNNSNQAVLGASIAPGAKHIYVDLTTQTLTAYQGSIVVLKTLISSGKWNPTPDGDFNIWIKLRSTRMTGGTGADFYDLPNVPYVMFFANSEYPESDGFGLHGAYWHDNFGHPMSHGCVNLRTVDAEELYNWVDPITTGTTTLATINDPGTPITITGTPPAD